MFMFNLSIPVSLQIPYPVSVVFQVYWVYQGTRPWTRGTPSAWSPAEARSRTGRRQNGKTT